MKCIVSGLNVQNVKILISSNLQNTVPTVEQNFIGESKSIKNNMSTYRRMSKASGMDKYELATWHDDYFGYHNYGVEFPDGQVLDPRVIKIRTRDFTEKERIELTTTPAETYWLKEMLMKFFKY